jgi:Tfp pilus assembly protein PilO
MNLSRNKLDGWKFDLAGIVVCLGLTAGGYALTLHPLIRDHRQAVVARDRLEDVQDESRQLMVRRTRLRRQLVSARAALESREVKLLAPSAANRRINELAQLAMDRSLKVDGIQPGLRRRVGAFAVVPIEIRAQGGYVACKDFVRELHRRYPDTGLSGMTVTGRGESAGIQLQLAWYTTLTDPQDSAVASAGGQGGR